MSEKHKEKPLKESAMANAAPPEKSQVKALLTLFLLVGGCEMGTDLNGPNIATLTLRADDGTVRDFYLGGYETVADCMDMVASETRSAAADRNDEFWTNPDFSYGGFEEKGWTRNIVVGGKCAVRAPAPRLERAGAEHTKW